MYITVNRIELIHFIEKEIKTLETTMINLEHIIEMRVKKDREKALANKNAIDTYIKSRCGYMIQQDIERRVQYCNDHLLFGFIPYGSKNMPEVRKMEDLWPIEEQILRDTIHSHYAHCLAHLQRNYGDIFEEYPERWWHSSSYYHHSKKYRESRNKCDSLRQMLDLSKLCNHGDVVTLDNHDLNIIYKDIT